MCSATNAKKWKLVPSDYFGVGTFTGISSHFGSVVTLTACCPSHPELGLGQDDAEVVLLLASLCFGTSP